MGRSTHMARLGFLLGAGLSLTASAGAATPTPTYHRDVARILQQHCQDCHRPGEVAPFSLLTYSHARKRASDIVTVTESRKMPPWPASTTEGGPFRDARVMSPAEIAVLAAWVAADCPEGDPKDAPPARTWTSDWALGEPDLVLSMPAAYTLTADGRDEHRVFVIPSGLTEGKWLSAIDFKPGNPRVVHHILAAFDTAGRARKLDADDPAPGYKVFGGFNLIPSGGLGGWAPGKRPQSLPSGVGRYLPARADVLLQVHYHKNGKAESDATRIGLYFAKGPIDKQVAGGMVTPPRSGFFRPKLLIPAGVANHEVTGAFTIAEDSHLTAVVPHMHWQGLPPESDSPRRLDLHLDPDRRLELQLAGHLRLRAANRGPEGNADRHARPLRQLGEEPGQPELASEGRDLGRADDRRDVHRLLPAHHRQRAPQEQPSRAVPGPDRTGRNRRLALSAVQNAGQGDWGLVFEVPGRRCGRTGVFEDETPATPGRLQRSTAIDHFTSGCSSCQAVAFWKATARARRRFSE
jgi:mono/diheme cytochrome c family protein